MKKLLVLAMLATGLASCGQKEAAKEETKTEAVAADSTLHAEAHSDSTKAYKCPMKCEEKKHTRRLENVLLVVWIWLRLNKSKRWVENVVSFLTHPF
jgi:hypothetical protein